MFINRVYDRFIHAYRLASSRRHSEDRVEVIDRGGELVVVVADGAGGVRGGAVASDALVEAVTLAADDPAFDLESVAGWSDVLTRTDAELARTLRGETTGVVLVVTSRGVLGVSAGDTEAYVVTKTGIDDLTASQGRKRLGSGSASPVPFFRAALDGVLVVGTDGLFKYASLENMVNAVDGRSPAEATERLVALVRLPSGVYPDDVGVVVVCAATG